MKKKTIDWRKILLEFGIRLSGFLFLFLLLDILFFSWSKKSIILYILVVSITLFIAIFFENIKK